MPARRRGATPARKDATRLRAVLLRRIFPEAVELPIEEIARQLRFADQAEPDRPYLVLNMVSSVDGRATIDGRSGPLSDRADQRLFHALRTTCDAVLVGTGTLRVERYGRLVREPELVAERARNGLRPQPIACVVSSSLALPFDCRLFQDPESTVLLFTDADVELPPVAAQLTVLRVTTEELAPRAVMRRLRREHGVRSVLCEGGPTLNAGLLAEGVVDELFLSLAPKLAGGRPGPTIVAGQALAEVAALALLWAHEHENALYLRYRVRR